MSKPFKFRFVTPITGIYVLACAAAVVVVILYTARSQSWFTPRKELLLQLPSSGSMGLKVGADVLMLGTPVGTITRVDIDIHEQNKPGTGELQIVADVRAVARIEARFFSGVRRDSRAIISKTLGIAGDSRVEITVGDGEPIEPGESIPAGADTSTSETVDRLLRRLEEVVIPTIEEFHATLKEARLGITDLRESRQQVEETLVALRFVLDRLDKGEGLAGRLLRDDDFANQVVSTVPKLSAALDRLSVILDDVQKTTTQLPELTRNFAVPLEKLPALIDQSKATMQTIDTLVANLTTASTTLPRTLRRIDDAAALAPSVLAQAEDTLREIDDLAEALQRSWLLGGGTGAPPPPGFPTINPALIGGAPGSAPSPASTPPGAGGAKQ